ncbi:hypothetical protein KIMC2_02710 [Xylocopilactobacillus apis]|uniref:Uncharacterized protein n=2 Tax=Xylocopilactobacillus apis TaxID=2932183 RepID=A0AAU9CP39_9LACO|nr:hypothetical protein KIMC2_02710 [Xylocopilactobacillus apis]
MIEFVHLKNLPSFDNKYVFAECFFQFGDAVVGDPDVRVLADSLKLSFDDTILRVNHHDNIFCNAENLVNQLSILSENVLKNTVLPTCIESFDGDIGFFIYYNNQEFLVVKTWGTEDFMFIQMSKADYLKQLEQAVKEL